MALRRENDQRYTSFWRAFVNFMYKNSGLEVSGVARSGSRRRGNYRPDSDLDIIFAVAGDPSREDVYPPLVKKLVSVLNVDASIGDSYHVINIQKDTLNFDLVLLPRWEFQSEINALRATSL